MGPAVPSSELGVEAQLGDVGRVADLYQALDGQAVRELLVLGRLVHGQRVVPAHANQPPICRLLPSSNRGEYKLCGVDGTRTYMSTGAERRRGSDGGGSSNEVAARERARMRARRRQWIRA